MYTSAKHIMALLLMNILLISLCLVFILPKVKYMMENVEKFALQAGISLGITVFVQFIMNNLLMKYLITAYRSDNKFRGSFVLALIGSGIIVLLTAIYGGVFWVLNQ